MSSRQSLLRLALAMAFLAGATLVVGLVFENSSTSNLLLLATLFGGYTAITIGANDAANNLSAAVGSKAIILAWALGMAALLEIAGAIIAGGSVIHTIKGEVIDLTMIGNEMDIAWIMLSALFAAAIWIHFATVMNAPISTTHTIIGGMVGAGITAGGMDVAHWPMLGTIASSWLVSPFIAGIISATSLFLIKQSLTYQTDITRAAKQVVPILVALMVWAFSAYLMLKGLRQTWQIDFYTAILSSLVVSIGIYLIVHPVIGQAADLLPPSKMAINTLFNLPLIFAAAIFSFAHGANDVANAIGPVTAVYEITLGLAMMNTSTMPYWILVLGALGLAIGLALYGYRLIKVVGYELTELDQIRAYSITLAVAITVILATELSLPVSTTHVTVGAVLGVGFLREYLKRQNVKDREKIVYHLSGKNLLINRFMDEFYASSWLQKRVMLKQLEIHSEREELTKQEHQELSKLYNSELVKRSTIFRILIAWVLTLPVTGILASLIYQLIRDMPQS